MNRLGHWIRKQDMKYWKEINRTGKTVVIVTHDENIARMTDRIITISDGKIVGDNGNF